MFMANACSTVFGNVGTLFLSPKIEHQPALPTIFKSYQNHACLKASLCDLHGDFSIIPLNSLLIYKSRLCSPILFPQNGGSKDEWPDCLGHPGPSWGTASGNASGYLEGLHRLRCGRDFLEGIRFGT